MGIYICSPISCPLILALWLTIATMCCAAALRWDVAHEGWGDLLRGRGVFEFLGPMDWSALTSVASLAATLVLLVITWKSVGVSQSMAESAVESARLSRHSVEATNEALRLEIAVVDIEFAAGALVLSRSWVDEWVRPSVWVEPGEPSSERVAQNDLALFLGIGCTHREVTVHHVKIIRPNRGDAGYVSPVIHMYPVLADFHGRRTFPMKLVPRLGLLVADTHLTLRELSEEEIFFRLQRHMVVVGYSITGYGPVAEKIAYWENRHIVEKGAAYGPGSVIPHPMWETYDPPRVAAVDVI